MAGVSAPGIHEPLVSERPPEKGEPLVGMALCLSGGGYRAMLFHLGALWRLYETGVLAKIDRISSVSGGSIISAFLGMRWAELKPSSSNDPARFQELIAQPIRRLASTTIDAGAILGGILLPGSISDKVAAAYKKYLFGDKTLSDLPDSPRFVINATNVQSGALWRFSKPYMADYRVGRVDSPRVPLATAVAASSAFPPVLSPVELELPAGSVKPEDGADLEREPFISSVVLTDGGVYDNLGLETAWKRHKTILVSDGGGKMLPEEHPKRDWGRHAYRVLEIIDNQVRSLRVRQLIEAYKTDDHDGAYWGIRTNIQDFPASGALSCPLDRTQALAGTPTRLKQLPTDHQEKLINWGYAVCDAALRSYFDPKLPTPAGFPYPASGV